MEMANLVDIKLSTAWQVTADVTGDFIRTTGQYECILQEIALEALTQEGDLFYDEGFGWSLLDFTHSENDELLELEIQQRVFKKLSWYQEINTDSIKVKMVFIEGTVKLSVKFKFVENEDIYNLQLQLDRINGEVVIQGA